MKPKKKFIARWKEGRTSENNKSNSRKPESNFKHFCGKINWSKNREISKTVPPPPLFELYEKKKRTLNPSYDALLKSYRNAE